MASLKGEYFHEIFGTYEITEHNKEEVINRINKPQRPEERRILRMYSGELLNEVLCGLGLESSGKYPKETDNTRILELEKKHEVLKEVFNRTSNKPV